MERRKFMQFATAGAVATAATQVLSAPAGASGSAVHNYSGTDLAGWEEALGDGLWTAPGQDPVNITDIATDHNGGESVLRANVNQRGVMAHNINFKRVIDATALNHIHTGSYEFRLPYLPAPGSWPDNAQTVEGGFFIWDGADTRLDYGLAFQWVLNPWLSTFGDIWCWTNTNGGSWGPSSHLNPDTEWHTFDFTVDPVNQATTMMIDGAVVPSVFVAEPKDASWGTEVAARFQAEIISLWPGTNSVAPSHRAEFRNWNWDWFEYAT